MRKGYYVIIKLLNLELIRRSGAKNVLLVHGEKQKMAILKEKIHSELGLPCYDPANGQTVNIKTTRTIPATISKDLFNSIIKTDSSTIKTRAFCLIDNGPKNKFNCKKARVHIMTEPEIPHLNNNIPKVCCKLSEKLLSFNPFTFLKYGEDAGNIGNIAIDVAFRILKDNLFVYCSINDERTLIKCGEFVSVMVEECAYKVEWTNDAYNEAQQVLVVLNKLGMM
jgi:hypothetical protein